MTTIRPRRSFIFAPGNKPDMFPKAMATGADIMCIDLEDAIAPQHKEQARAATVDWFATAELDDRVECMVRINPPRTPDGMKDVQAILDSAKAPPSLMLAKVKSPAEVIALDELFDEFKIASRLQVIIETNEALEAAWEIARCSTRIDAIFFGGVDMAADLRCEYTWEALLYARSRVVHAAAGAGVDVIDVPFLDLNDMEGMKREAEAARALGFCGKGSIHPKQVPVLNEIFSPSEAEIAHAKRIVEAFEQGDSGLVVIDGKLIEKPVLRSMYRVLARAGAAG
jgi:citrate lyase beta subunit